MRTINEDHVIYRSWNIRCDREIWKIKILKSKKTPTDIIILHICTINYNHMMYGSCDMECNRQNFLSFWTIFCPFTCQWTQKIKIKKKKMKKMPRDIIISHKCTINDNHDVWFLRSEVWLAEFCHFGLFFALLHT